MYYTRWPLVYRMQCFLPYLTPINMLACCQFFLIRLLYLFAGLSKNTQLQKINTAWFLLLPDLDTPDIPRLFDNMSVLYPVEALHSALCAFSLPQVVSA